MNWHDRTPKLEQTRRMEQIAEIVRRFDRAAISAPTAIEKIRELLEPRIVRVGETHATEVTT